MKRYFEAIGKRMTIALELTPPASFDSVETLSEKLKMQLREINKKEYISLTRKYTK